MAVWPNDARSPPSGTDAPPRRPGPPEYSKVAPVATTVSACVWKPSADSSIRSIAVSFVVTSARGAYSRTDTDVRSLPRSPRYGAVAAASRSVSLPSAARVVSRMNMPSADLVVRGLRSCRSDGSTVRRASPSRSMPAKSYTWNGRDGTQGSSPSNSRRPWGSSISMTASPGAAGVGAVLGSEVNMPGPSVSAGLSPVVSEELNRRTTPAGSLPVRPATHGSPERAGGERSIRPAAGAARVVRPSPSALISFPISASSSAQDRTVTTYSYGTRNSAVLPNVRCQDRSSRLESWASCQAVRRARLAVGRNWWMPCCPAGEKVSSWLFPVLRAIRVAPGTSRAVPAPRE